MAIDIYLRPLRESDAHTSWCWRNDPDIWKYTGSRPDKYITEEIEREWICRALSDQCSRRYAICIYGTGEYIGNVQLTDINNGKAQFHIFVGEKRYWGIGVGTLATAKLLEMVFQEMPLVEVYLYVKKANNAAMSAYIKNGFVVQKDCGDELLMAYKAGRSLCGK